MVCLLALGKRLLRRRRCYPDYMSPENDLVVRELIEQRLDQLTVSLAEHSAELRRGQERIDRDMHDRLNTLDQHMQERLTRIEQQTTEHNGRMTKVEAWKIAVDAREDMRRSDRSWFQPVITGVVTILMAAVFVALLNMDKL